MVFKIGVSSGVSSIYVVGTMEDGWPNECTIEMMQEIKNELRLQELRLLIEHLCPETEHGYEIAEAIIDVVDHEKLLGRLKDIQKKSDNEPEDS